MSENALGSALCFVLLTLACHSKGPSGARDAAPSPPSAAKAGPGAERTRPPLAKEPQTQAAAAGTNAPPPEPEPLSGPQSLALDVEGFNAAVASVPLGARQRRPVVFALHGNYDRPEWQCQVWRDVVGPHPWILCPRGVPRSDAPKRLDRWTYAGADKLEQELDAAFTALKTAYPDYVDPEWPIFTGFSLGAILGVRLLSRKEPRLRFRAAVLVEGGYKGWHFASAKAFAAQGGERVLFACGQSACRHASKQASKILARHEVASEIASGGDIGHTYDGQVADAIQQQWGFVVGQDSRFGGGSGPDPSGHE